MRGETGTRSGRPSIDDNEQDADISRIFYSSDSGSGWSNPRLISSGADNHEPSIAVDASGHPHAVWRSGTEAVYSSDTGTGWSAPETVSGGTIGLLPRIAISSDGRSHVVWQGNDGMMDQVYYSTDSGPGWSSPAALSWGSNKYNPDIAVDVYGRPNVVWQAIAADSSMQAYFTRKEGSAWSAELQLSSGTDNSNPRIAVDASGYAQVAWSGNTGSGRQIYCRTASPAGWSEPEQVSTGSDNGHPSFSIDPSGFRHLAWEGSVSSVPQVFYSADGGNGWGPPHALTADTENVRPEVEVSAAGNPCVIWQGADGIRYSADIGYVVNASVAGGGGSVSPASQWVEQGDDATIEITAGEHCSIAGITDNGTTQAVANPYVVSDVAATHDIVVSFDVAVDASVPGGHGSVSPANQSVAYGTGASIDLAPDTGYHPAYIVDNGVPQAASDPYVISGVTSWHQVQVVYAIDTFGVNAYVSGGHGNVSPANQSVDYGSTATITLTPDAGYHTETISDNGVAQPVTGGTYVINNVTGAHNVEATFAADFYQVTASASFSGHGAADPSTQSVAYGNAASVDIVPDTGYHLAFLTDNGVSVTPADPYVISNVKEAHDVVASFEPDPCPVSVTVSGNGTAKGAGAYYYGDTVLLVATPAEGWHFAGWTEAGTEVSTEAAWSFTAEAAWDLTAGFAIDTFTVNASADGNGTVTPTTQSVEWGSNASIAITPAAHCHIASITDNGAAVAVSSPYVISNVREDHEVVATFAADTDTWYLAEGCTGEGFETWILVANSNQDPVTLDISFPTADGLFAPAALQGYELAGNTRVSFNAGSFFTSYDISSRGLGYRRGDSSGARHVRRRPDLGHRDRRHPHPVVHVVPG